MCATQRNTQSDDIVSYQVTITPSTYNATNMVTLVRRFGRTQIKVYWKSGTCVKDTIKNLIGCFKQCTHSDKILSPSHVTMLVILCDDVIGTRGGVVAMVERLGSHPHSTRSLNKDLTFQELEKVWLATSSVSSNRLRLIAKSQLSSISKLRYGISMLCRPQLRIPTLASGHAHILREGAKRILKSYR